LIILKQPPVLYLTVQRREYLAVGNIVLCLSVFGVIVVSKIKLSENLAKERPLCSGKSAAREFGLGFSLSVFYGTLDEAFLALL
jgi:hypothetical protein